MPQLLPRTVLLLATLLAALLEPQNAPAHEGGEPLVIVPLDHVMPGSSFPVTGADLGAAARVSFSLVRDEESVHLGERKARSDGHFETSLVLSDSFPDGYAQLTAQSSDGSKASTWILVGERTAATPSAPGEAGWGREQTAIALALSLGLIGAALALATALSRRRTRSSRAE